jgi:hypothetical protein
MDVHDLALSKYGAGREKDLEFTRALARVGATKREVLQSRLADVETTDTHRAQIAARIDRDFR